MSELKLAVESIPLALQTLGLMAPAIACCLVKLNWPGATKYVMSTNRDYFKKTHQTPLDLQKQELKAHDHPFGGKTPEKGAFVVEIPKGDVVDTFVAWKSEIEEIKGFIKEREKIPGTDFIHNHKGKNLVGPYEHLVESNQPTS